ncbi:hypothetical protein DCC62_30865 [candidate division KSB1 bacterium]|nr:MAG: hypothetical protein DCC62_30865 [candidate division KSB1 bacterium]
MSSVIIGDKAFLSECVEITEHHRKNFSRMIYRQNCFILCCRQIICHKLSEFYSVFEKLIA